MRLPLFKKTLSGGAGTSAVSGGFDNAIIVDDASGDPRLIFSGPWQINIVPTAYDQTLSTSGPTNASTVTFTFVGSAIAVVGALPAHELTAGSEYYLDDNLVGVFTEVVSEYERNVTYVSVNSLDSDIQHILEIKLLPGDGPYTLDYIAYQPPTSSPFNTSTPDLSTSADASAATSTSSSPSSSSNSTYDTTSMTSTFSSSAIVSSSPTLNPTAPPTSDMSHHISRSLIGGVAVGAVGFVVFILAVLYFFCRRHGGPAVCVKKLSNLCRRSPTKDAAYPLPDNFFRPGRVARLRSEVVSTGSPVSLTHETLGRFYVVNSDSWPAASPLSREPYEDSSTGSQGHSTETGDSSTPLRRDRWEVSGPNTARIT